MTRGFAAPEVERAYTRAHALCRQIDATPQLFPVLRGLIEFYTARGNLAVARELGEQLLNLAHSAQDDALLLEACQAMGFTLFLSGDSAAARPYLEQGIALYDPKQHHAHAFVYGRDPGLACLAFLSFALWHLGYPYQALEQSKRMLALAEQLAHPFSSAISLTSAGWLAEFRRDVPATFEPASAQIAIAEKYGFSSWVATSRVLLGWVLAEQGHIAEGIAQIRDSLAMYRAIGGETGYAHFLVLMAELHGRVGQITEGLSLLAEAAAVIERTGERFSESEVYRVKGELLLKSGVWSSASRVQKQKAIRKNPQSAIHDVQSQAEACFDQALAVARQQSAKSLELRAAMSLSRFWQQQGKKKQAHKLLAGIYGWFSEGFDTVDLQEARTLLAALE